MKPGLLVLLLTSLAPAEPALPFWHFLTTLNEAERANAVIDVELDRTTPEPARAHARRIEQLWNEGRPEDALAESPALEAELAPASAAVGIAWRRPIPSPEMSFDPFRISTRDSVYRVSLEPDYYGTWRRLYAVLALQGDGAGSRISVNLSTDLGRTWRETFILSGYSYKLNDVAGRIMRSKFWLLYTGGTSATRNHALWCRKFSLDNGAPDTFMNGAASWNIYNAPTRDTLKELEVVSSQLFANAAIYAFALLADDSLAYCYVGVTRDTAWTITRLPVGNACEGLDACWNDGRLSGDTSVMLVSYVGNGDSVHILRSRLGGVWDRYRSTWCGPAGSFPRTTAVGCHRETLLCAYTYQGDRVRYQVRRGLQGSWLYGSPPQDTTRRNGLADVACAGGYMHLAFWQSTGIGSYTRRPLVSSIWETPRRYDGGQGVAELQPEVRWYGRGDSAGIVWITPDITRRYACFSVLSFGAITEQPGSNSTGRPLQVRPAPGGIMVHCAMSGARPVAIRILDAAGREVGRHVPTRTGDWFWPAPASGIYFVTLAGTGPLTGIKVAVARP